MVSHISQQTFNEAVQENINDLGLSPEEAVTEAIAQFKSQGADLSLIITELSTSYSFENLNNVIKTLEEFKDKSISEECVDLLTTLKQECDKGIQFGLEAGRSGAYDVILDIFLKPEAEKALKITCLQAMISVMTKQPDLLNDRGIQVILSNLENKDEPEIQKFTLKWCKECCVMHEMNRQKLVDLNIVNTLTALLKEGNPVVLKEALSVLRTLILDDDVRVEFGRAHEHARIIAVEALGLIMELIAKFKTDDLLISDLMLTLSSLLVRTEFCKTVEQAMGIELIRDVMTNFIENEKITRQCFKVIKSLAGNDECKVHIIQKGLASVIISSLSVHQGKVATASAGLGCIAALSLRCPDNSNALFEASAPEVIVETMKTHPTQKSIQRAGSWAVRNMVSRSRYQNKHFLELGVDEILQKSLITFKEFEYDIKAALRDLECDVELKEEWTGKGGRISSESVILKQD